MKKQQKKLVVVFETLVTLQTSDLDRVQGGAACTTMFPTCHTFSNQGDCNSARCV